MYSNFCCDKESSIFCDSQGWPFGSILLTAGVNTFVCQAVIFSTDLTYDCHIMLPPLIQATDCHLLFGRGQNSKWKLFPLTPYCSLASIGEDAWLPLQIFKNAKSSFLPFGNLTFPKSSFHSHVTVGCSSLPCFWMETHIASHGLRGPAQSGRRLLLQLRLLPLLLLMSGLSSSFVFCF